MKAADQGTRTPRHLTVPRTLIFLTSTNPHSGAAEVLLLKGAPTKRLWANKYNGLGGHVEQDEDVLAAAQRELVEETGLRGVHLVLRGVIHIDAGRDEQGDRPGVMVFVFHGATDQRALQATREGVAEWLPVAQLAAMPLVDDLVAVIPRALAPGPVFFGHYAPQPDGALTYRFTP